MPDRDVRTLQDLIWYQYAKIVARRPLGSDAKWTIGLLKERRSAFISAAVRGRIDVFWENA